jgi:hypothetical protein
MLMLLLLLDFASKYCIYNYLFVIFAFAVLCNAIYITEKKRFFLIFLLCNIIIFVSSNLIVVDALHSPYFIACIALAAVANFVFVRLLIQNI